MFAFCKTELTIHVLITRLLKALNFLNLSNLIIFNTGEYGGTIVHQLACKQLIDNFHETPKQSVSIRKIVEKTKRKKHPIFLHFWLLYWRTILVMIREPLLTTLRLIGILLVATVISFLYARPIGVDDGCFRKPSLDMLKYLNPGFDLLTNIAFIFFSILFITIVSKIPVVLTFSLEMPVFLKERENGWYSCLTYYLAKSAADIPLQIVFPFIYMSISYYFTGLQNFIKSSTFFKIILFCRSTTGVLAFCILDDQHHACFVYHSISWFSAWYFILPRPECSNFCNCSRDDTGHYLHRLLRTACQHVQLFLPDDDAQLHEVCF